VSKRASPLDCTVKRKADSIMTERVTDVFWTVLAIAGAERCYGIIGGKLNL
jgi:hypothetical protein